MSVLSTRYFTSQKTCTYRLLFLLFFRWEPCFPIFAARRRAANLTQLVRKHRNKLLSNYPLRPMSLVTPSRFSDDAVTEEAAEHTFQLIEAKEDLSEAWFEVK